MPKNKQQFIKKSVSPYFGAAMPKREGATINRFTGEEYVVYDTGRVYLDEGWYSHLEIATMLDGMKRLNEAAKKGLEYV